MQSFLTFLTWTGSVRTQHSGGPSTCIHQQRGCVVEKYHHLLQFIKTTENCLKSWEQNGCGVGQNIHLPLFFTALAQGNNKVIWLSVFAACPCYVPAGDVRETSINSAILSTNCSICGYEKSRAIYFSMKNKYVAAFKAWGWNSDKAEWSNSTSWATAGYTMLWFLFSLQSLYFSSVVPPSLKYPHFICFLFPVLLKNNNV